jgi:hypothetical protein
MRKGEAFVGRARSGQEHEEAIKGKVHPALLEMAQLFKESIQALESLGQHAPRELTAPIEERLEKGCQEIQRRLSGPTQPPKGYFPCETIFPLEAAQEHEEVAAAAFLHWERHKTPLDQDIERMNSGDGGASRRFQRTFADYEAIRCDQKKPKPFKGKIDHSNIFGFGLGLGLENLTGDELAIFFDRFCPGCRDAHNKDALRRQRTEFLKAMVGGMKPAASARSLGE